MTWSNVAWAFSTMTAGNWHPLTWLSHMLDCQIFGLQPGWHHLVNALLHGANTVLLFVVLRAMTGTAWRSALVAALFAVHPLHVESVAWIAERKDLLSTFFGLWALWAYARYVGAVLDALWNCGVLFRVEFVEQADVSHASVCSVAAGRVATEEILD